MRCAPVMFAAKCGQGGHMTRINYNPDEQQCVAVCGSVRQRGCLFGCNHRRTGTILLFSGTQVARLEKPPQGKVK